MKKSTKKQNKQRKNACPPKDKNEIITIDKVLEKHGQNQESNLRMLCIEWWNTNNQFKQDNSNRPPISSCAWGKKQNAKLWIL